MKTTSTHKMKNCNYFNIVIQNQMQQFCFSCMCSMYSPLIWRSEVH